jgi:hypothetical protein
VRTAEWDFFFYCKGGDEQAAAVEKKNSRARWRLELSALNARPARSGVNPR